MNNKKPSLFSAAVLSTSVLVALVCYCSVSRGMDTANASSERTKNNTSTASTSLSASASSPTTPVVLESIRTLDFDWQDNSRQRVVPARLYLPRTWPESTELAASGTANPSLNPAPLIVFSHGLGGSRKGYQYLGRFWASQGYASLHVQHIGSDNQLWLGNPFGLAGRLQAAAKDSEAVARAKDVSFALTQLLALPQMGGRIDVSRIAAAGHSYGANTTMLLAGATVPNKGDDGQALNLRDPRIKAAILLSAPPFYGYSNPAAILGSIALPTLHITATGDDILVPGYGSGYLDRVKVFEAMGDARKSLVVFAGGSHSIFTDRTNTGGAELNPKVKAATQALSLAFLKQTLGGEVNAVADWQPEFADLLARFVPAK